MSVVAKRSPISATAELLFLWVQVFPLPLHPSPCSFPFPFSVLGCLKSVYKSHGSSWTALYAFPAQSGAEVSPKTHFVRVLSASVKCQQNALKLLLAWRLIRLVALLAATECISPGAVANHCTREFGASGTRYNAVQLPSSQ